MKNNKLYQSLKDGEIHIHLSYVEAVDLTDENLLNTAESTRANAFKFSKDRTLYSASHIYLRQILSQYGTLPPAKWAFKTNAYGKPSIANKGYEWLHFNLSHTQGLIACATRYQQEVGIDVEQQKWLPDIDSLCQYTFSITEAADVLSLSSRPAQQQRFFSYWTLKEAYIKARGMGLSIPLQQFNFIQDENNNWHLHCEPELKDKGSRWQFFNRIFNNGKDHYHLSVAAKGIKRDAALRMRIIS